MNKLSPATTTSADGQKPTVPTLEMLLVRGDDCYRPTLENRVAYQWEQEGDTLGYCNGVKRNRVTLDWLIEALRAPSLEHAVLDVGCANGNMLLMLNAKLGHPANVRLIGIDLCADSLRYASAFAECIPGYSNCVFEVADLSRKLPFSDDRFDAVNLGDVLEHMDDPGKAIDELVRVLKPGGVLIISTPLRNSVFKRLAAFCNWITRGRLNQVYYRGKGAELDSDGDPIMKVAVGNDHVSEMTLPQLRELLATHGLVIEKQEMMSVMSGSKWFNGHPFLLAALMFLEAIHTVCQFSSWAHGVCLLARLPSRDGFPGK